jgi:hypothetical protein
VSKIWDSLEDLERHLSKHDCKEDIQNHWDAILDRRSTKRLWLYAPLLVYGYGAADEPFHERTEALYANARGGLITLSTTVNLGQALLLINTANLKEQKCSVLRQKSSYLKRSAIVVEFPQPVPDFWDTSR